MQLIVLLISLFFLAACSSNSGSGSSVVDIQCEIETEVPTSLKSLIDTHVSTYQPVGMAVLISSPKTGRTRYLYGMSDKENSVEVTSETLWHSMSQGKSYTVAAFLELFEQGAVDLDSSLASHGVSIPDHPSFGAPTIRQAMNHTTLIERPFNTALLDPSFLSTTDPNNTREKHVADAIAMDYVSTTNCCSSGQTSTDFSNTFTMGSTVYYSDANTVALTLALENITGKSWGQAIHDLVLTPWGLDNSFLLQHDIPENPSSYSSPYLRSKRYENFATDSSQPQITFSDQFVTYATGGGTTYATLCDFEEFSNAFYKGEQVSTAARVEQTNYVTLPSGGVHYGLGIQGFPLLGPEQEIIAHFGGGPGGGGVVAYNPKNDAHIVIMTNYSFPDNEVVNLLLSLLTALEAL